MPMVEVSNGGSPTTLTLISKGGRNFTAEVGALYLINIFNNNLSGITITGGTILSKVTSTSSGYAQGEMLVQATSTTVKINNYADVNSFITKLS